MTRDEAEKILRAVDYWHYPFELPWGRMEATKPGHNERHTMRWNHSRRALADLLHDNGFDSQFLDPQGPMPSEYLSGHRVSLIARRV